MPTLIAPLAALLAMGAVGVAALHRYAGWLDPLEQVAYGLPLGFVVASLALLALAIPFGLTTALVAGLSVACAAGAAALWAAGSPGPSWRAGRARLAKLAAYPPAWLARGLRSRVSLLPTLVLGAFVVRWVFLWHGSMVLDASGLWAPQLNWWSDGALHLGDVASFAYGDNFPPQNPRFAGHPYHYHYLADFTAAALVKLGLGPVTAMMLHTFCCSVLVALGVYAFARRLTRDRQVATLTVGLFLLGGGLAWLVTMQRINTSHDVWGTLWNHAWDFGTMNDAPGVFRWGNQYDSLISIQRGYLYGLPLALLVLTLLFEAVRPAARPRGLFVAAGFVAGLLPLAHLSTLLALALVTPFLFLLFPSWRWGWFFATWIVVAVPQLYFQQEGGRGATAAARLAAGWVAAPDPWPWFWAKNLGAFLPLVLLALAARRLLPPRARRFLWAFMPLFVIFNVVIFQPWDWDNIKILLYWFLAVCVLVAALLVRTWREARRPAMRALVAGMVASMVLSGLLLNLYQLRTHDHYTLLTPEEVTLAGEIRERTPPHAVFAAGLQHNNPVHVLAGRRVMTGYPGWLWTQSIDTTQRERDLRAIMAYAPDAPALIKEYDVAYVVIGPVERKDLQANEAAYRAHYPVVIATAQYEVFAVGAH